MLKTWLLEDDSWVKIRAVLIFNLKQVSKFFMSHYLIYKSVPTFQRCYSE